MQYEGLHELCFRCGCYGHKESACKATNTNDIPEDHIDVNNANSKGVGGKNEFANANATSFGLWTVGLRNNRQLGKTTKGKSEIHNHQVQPWNEAEIVESVHVQPQLPPSR